MNEAVQAQFEGVWDVTHATLPTGIFAYTGAITIQRLGAIFVLDWDISAGRYVGIGLPVANRLFVSCGEQYAGLGLALYQSAPDGNFIVHWCTRDLDGRVGGGHFGLTGRGSWVGEHEVVYEYTTGQLYGAWTLTVRKVDQVYDLAWRKGTATHFVGVGLEMANGIAAGWYPDQAQLALLDYRFDADNPRQLHAVWALGNYTMLGTETLTRRAA